MSTEGQRHMNSDLNQEQLLAFISKGGSFTRELMFCKSCSQQCLLEKAKEAGKVNTEGCLRVGTAVGTSVPVICPVCNNKNLFIRKMLTVVEVDEEIVVKDGKVVEVVSTSTPENIDAMTLSYQCDIPDCNGAIVIHPGDYRLSADTGD